MCLACGGRTLDGGLAGDGGGGHGGNVSLTSNGNGNNGNGNSGNGNGNSGNGDGNGNGSGTTVSTTGGAGPSGGTSVTVVTSTNGTTSGSMSNGTCDDPYVLRDSFKGLTVGESTFFGSCKGVGPEIFFSWEAPRTGNYRIHTVGSAIDTVLYRLNRPGCDARVLDCNDDTDAAGSSELLFGAERGDRMGFVLDSYYAPGEFQLAIEGTDAPPCGGAYAELSGVGQLIHQQLPLDDTTLSDVTADACEGKAPRLKFDWTAPKDGRFVFDTVGSNYDTVLVVRTICQGPAGETCNDDEFGILSGIVATATEGQVLRVEIAAFGGNYVPQLGDGDVPVVVLNVREE